MEYAEKRQPSVRITYDEMEAYLLLPVRRKDEEAYTEEEVFDAIAKRGVRFGVDEGIVRQMIVAGIYGKETVIARGEPMEAGVDGFFKFTFNVDFNTKPAIRSDGTVDYWSIHAVEIVEEGQVIATYTEPKPGKNGMTVTGKQLIAKRGRPLPPLTGRGFSRSEDNLVYTALINGKIEKQGNRIQILPIYEIFSDVDLRTGSIDFRGDVIIHGNVTPEASIKATGSITVDGICEACTLEAGKDIILRGGVIGRGKGKLKSKGNIFAKFIEFAYVEAEGFIEANSSLNSTIVSYDKVYMNGKAATIVGGKVYATRGVEAYSFGNDSEVKTEVAVGVQRMISHRIMTLESMMEANQALIAKINAGLQQFEDLKAQTGQDYSKDERRVALLRTKIVKQAEMSADNEELERLYHVVENSQGATIKVVKEVYPNVSVSIHDYLVNVREVQKAVEFVEHNGKVVMMSLTD